MAENYVRVVVDTNVLISAFIFDGKPQGIIDLILEEKVEALISPVLLSELIEVLTKKFSLSFEELKIIEDQILEDFTTIYPKKEIHILKDEDDNRVLEAALEGNCDYIVTGDKELLELGGYKKIKILSAEDFLKKLDLN